jgi:hypothetical protein
VEWQLSGHAANIGHLLFASHTAGLSDVIDGQVGQMSFWQSTILDSGSILLSFTLQSETAFQTFRNVALRTAE